MTTIMLIRNAVFAALSTILITSCVSYNGVKPISPPVRKPGTKSVLAAPVTLVTVAPVYNAFPDKPIAQVESLQPILRWGGTPSALSYDVIIYSAVAETGSKKFKGRFMQGKEIYYREAIRETSHKVEESLQPDTAYVWSVRTRAGTNSVSRWSTFNFQNFFFFMPLDSGRNYWWAFRTPKQ